MKKLLFILIAAAISFCANAKSSNDTTVCFKISPAMSCVNCENKIKTNLRYENGISAIEANAPGDVVKIKFNKNKTNEIKISKAFAKIGYKAVASGAACNKNASCTHKTCDGNKACAGKSCAGEKNCCKNKTTCTAEKKECCKK